MRRTCCTTEERTRPPGWVSIKKMNAFAILVPDRQASRLTVFTRIGKADSQNKNAQDKG